MNKIRTLWPGLKGKAATTEAEVVVEAVAKVAAETGAETVAEAPVGLQHAREALHSSLTEQTEQVPPAAEVQVGRRLKAAREALKLEASDVAQRLRLGERQILALETGDLAALPGRTFVRGFVRGYARVVALDEALLLKILDGVDKLAAPRLELPESTHVAMPGNQGQSNRDSLMVASGLILLLAAVLLYFFLPEQSWMPVRSGQWTEDQQAAPEWTQIVEDPASTPAEPDGASATPATDGTVADSPAPVTDAAPVVRGDAQFSFAQESWLEVRDKNDVILSSRRHAAGTSHAVSGAPPLTVAVGRASGVTLTYRGKPVPLHPNAETDTARVILP
ncbi:MAG: DUF4115 domain-containing protein [Zoogloeaceae bacterium]|jgi:cytoskeleton protein RodZ|nr:DUF4115 domain-containing protein [Zoogloeaceae bacterium]